MKNQIYKYLSYFAPIKLETVHSLENGYLEVTINRGTKELNTENANFSFGSLHKVFQFAFREFPLNTKAVNSVLILGFGAGSVKKILRSDLHYNGLIVGVEHDQTIINLAEKYFNLVPSKKNVEILIMDALNYLESKKEKFDLIIIDLFKDLDIPAQFFSLNFFNKIRTHLNKNGQVIFNVIAPKKRIEKLKKMFTIIGFNIKFKQITINKSTNYIFYLKTKNR